ncbi:MAG TPA: glycine oxidase ThiO [Armatimonadota bacterium]|jgi:glycine oxidase
MQIADVIVIGGGITGLGLARELAGRGLSVTLLDRTQPGREASWASAGMLAPQGELSEGSFLQLCLESNRLYPEFRAAVEEETGIRCYHREAATLALALTDEDETEFRHTYERQRADGLQVEWLNGDEARKIEPALSDKVRGGMYLPGDRHIENRLLVPALEQSCRMRGVEIVDGALVTKILTEGGRAVGVDTILGPRYGRTIVNAAGSWAAAIDVPNDSLRPPVFPVRGQMLAITLPRPDFLSRAVRSRRSYLVPRHDNRLFLGATMEQVGFDKRNTVWGLNKLLSGALELFPELEVGTVQEVWSGLRPGSADNHPVLGLTSLPGYVLATGLFRNGLLLAPVMAQTLADVVTTGETPALIAPFNIARFAAGVLAAGRIPGA